MKIISLLSNINIKIKYFKQGLFNLFLKNPWKFNIRDNTVLLTELLPYHGEVLPGLVKYLLDLNYNVDIVLNKYQRNFISANSGLFYCFKDNEKVRVKVLSVCNINILLRSSHVKKYKRVIINTFHDDYIKFHFYKIDFNKLIPICMIHNYNITNEYFMSNNIISLVKIECLNRKPPIIVNSHYFGNFPKHDKSYTTTFIILNTTNLFRRNIYLLLNACEELYKKGIYNFNIKIIGNGIIIPEKYFKNFQIFGYMDFNEMYNEINNSDFILAVIDQASVQYTNKASGTYQLCYGFNKPIILHKKFSNIAGFNDQNSILYDDNDDLSDAMVKCINLSNTDYANMVYLLGELSKNIYNESRNNLKSILENNKINL